MAETTTLKQDSADTESEGSGSWFSRLRTRLGFQEAPSVRDVLESALREQGKGAQVFAPEQREMLLRLIRFGELRVDDVMVPRADITAVEDTATLQELLLVFRQGGHSRVPVYHETLDDLKGMIHVKDLLSWIVDRALPSADGAPTAAQPTGNRLAFGSLDLTGTIASSSDLYRPVLFVPPSMPALNLMLRMQSTRIHLALVVDEYGGTDGLVSIEDLVEQIVGEIEDEHDDDDDESLLVDDPKLGLVASARTPIADLEARLGKPLIDPADEEEVDTLGGLVMTLLGRVPIRGELIVHPSGIEFEVLDADPRRIKKVRIHLRAPVIAGREADDKEA